MSQSNLNQIGGNFNSAIITTVKALYCLPGATPSLNQSVYEISTFVDGTLDTTNFPVQYTNETGDVLTLTAAQIATLKAGGCGAADYEYTTSLVCAAGVTLERRSLMLDGVATGVTVFFNPTTNVAVATPATFTEGACTILKTPSAASARNTATVGTTLVAQTIPAGGPFRQLTVANRSNFDIIISGTTIGGAGAGTFSQIVPRQGTIQLALSINPDEGTIATVNAQAVTTAPFTGVAPIGTLIFNYKN